MKVAIYTRVSTKAQNNSSQILALQQYVEERGWDYDLYSDVESARKTRPLKQKIMNLIREGIKYDAIVVWSLDRWARNTTELLQNMNELQLRGVNFITINNNLDLQQSGQEALKLLSSFYEFELKVISERTKLGIKRAKQEGKQLGRPVGKKDNAKRNNFKYLVREALKRRDKDESNGIYNSLLSYFDKNKFNNLEDLDAIIKLDYQERTKKFDDKLEYSSVMSWLREDDDIIEKKNDNKTIYKLSPEEMNRIINFSQFIITTKHTEKDKKDDLLTKCIEKYMAEFAVSKHYAIPFRDKDIYDVEDDNACLIVNGKKLLVKESLNRYGCLLVKKSEIRTVNAPDAVMLCIVNPSQSYVKIVGFEKTSTIKKMIPEYVNSKTGMIYRIEQKDLKPIKIPTTPTVIPDTFTS